MFPGATAATRKEQRKMFALDVKVRWGKQGRMLSDARGLMGSYSGPHLLVFYGLHNIGNIKSDYNPASMCMYVMLFLDILHVGHYPFLAIILSMWHFM